MVGCARDPGESPRIVSIITIRHIRLFCRPLPTFVEECSTVNMQSVDLFLLSEKTSNHGGLPVIHTIKSKCDFYHYLCDGTDDRVSRRGPYNMHKISHTCIEKI